MYCGVTGRTPPLLTHKRGVHEIDTSWFVSAPRRKAAADSRCFLPPPGNGDPQPNADLFAIPRHAPDAQTRASHQCRTQGIQGSQEPASGAERRRGQYCGCQDLQRTACLGDDGGRHESRHIADQNQEYAAARAALIPSAVPLFFFSAFNFSLPPAAALLLAISAPDRLRVRECLRAASQSPNCRLSRARRCCPALLTTTTRRRSSP